MSVFTLLNVLSVVCLGVVIYIPFPCAATFCSSSSFNNVTECDDPLPRDLLFLVDASNTMDRRRFYREMLDYTLALYCAFPQQSGNQAGMVLFSEKIFVRIPLAQYNREEWFREIEAVRADETACCSCCTREFELA